MSSTSSPDHYDFISLGSSEGGRFTAWTLARDRGKRCTVIERQWVGGSCPNVACLPSKNYVQSGKVAHELSLGGSYGLGAYTAAAGGQIRADMTSVKARKTAMVQGMMDLHMSMFRDTGVELIRGTGRFAGPKKIQIAVDDGGSRIVTADSIVICTGSTSRVGAGIPGLVEAQPLTHVEILDLDDLPRHLVVLGGGYVGLEFAQAFRRLGSEVTLIERNAQILKREDPDVAEALAAVLAAEGVRILTSAHVAQVTGRSGDSATVTVTVEQQQHVVTASHVLVATGRTPNTAGIGLEAAGVELAGDGTGHVKVDAHLRTTADGVFAVGDCAGSPYFTHVGYDDFRVVYDQISARHRRPGGVAGRQVRSTLFTSPELAQVGLREREAREKGVAVRVATLPMAAFLRTRTMGGGAEAVGFAKVLVEADGDRILGFVALGPSAGEMLPVVQLAMKLGAPYTEIANLTVAHPTMCEGLVQLFESVPAGK